MLEDGAVLEKFDSNKILAKTVMKGVAFELV